MTEKNPGWQNESLRHAEAKRHGRASPSITKKPKYSVHNRRWQPDVAGADMNLVRELELWGENTRQLQYSSGNPWRRNFLRKMRKGVYDHRMAVEAIAKYHVPRILESYNREFGSDNKLSGLSLDKPTKMHIAWNWVSAFEEEAKRGEHDWLLVKELYDNQRP